MLSQVSQTVANPVHFQPSAPIWHLTSASVANCRKVSLQSITNCVVTVFHQVSQIRATDFATLRTIIDAQPCSTVNISGTDEILGIISPRDLGCWMRGGVISGLSRITPAPHRRQDQRGACEVAK